MSIRTVRIECKWLIHMSNNLSLDNLPKNEPDLSKFHLTTALDLRIPTIENWYPENC